MGSRTCAATPRSLGPADASLCALAHLFDATIGAAPPEGRYEHEIELSWAGETARHVDSVVHRWLQRIAEDELGR